MSKRKVEDRGQLDPKKRKVTPEVNFDPKGTEEEDLSRFQMQMKTDKRLEKIYPGYHKAFPRKTTSKEWLELLKIQEEKESRRQQEPKPSAIQDYDWGTLPKDPYKSSIPSVFNSASLEESSPSLSRQESLELERENLMKNLKCSENLFSKVEEGPPSLTQPQEETEECDWNQPPANPCKPNIPLTVNNYRLEKIILSRQNSPDPDEADPARNTENATSAPLAPKNPRTP